MSLKLFLRMHVFLPVLQMSPTASRLRLGRAVWDSQLRRQERNGSTSQDKLPVLPPQKATGSPIDLFS